MTTAFFLMTTALGTFAALIGFLGITLGILFPLLAAAAAFPIWMAARAEPVRNEPERDRVEDADVSYRQKLNELWERRHDQDVVA